MRVVGVKWAAGGGQRVVGSGWWAVAEILERVGGQAVPDGEGALGEEVEVSGDGIGDDDAGDAGGVGGVEAIERILEDEAAGGVGVGEPGGGEEEVWGRLDPRDIIAAAGAGEEVADPEALELGLDPRARGARGDDRRELGGGRLGEPVADAREWGQIVESLAFHALTPRVPVIPIEGAVEAAFELLFGVEARPVAADAVCPELHIQGLAVFGEDGSPGGEDGAFGIGDEPVEVPEDGLDGWHGGG